MNDQMKPIKIGLILVMLALVFGIVMGVMFGVAEDSFKSYVSEGVAANAAIHDDASNGKIWRYVQRAHFHATGIAAFSIGLLLLVMFSTLTAKLKNITSILIGLGGLYPFSWLTMYILAPSMGRGPAHSHILTEMFTYVGVIGLLLGMILLCLNLFFGMFKK